MKRTVSVTFAEWEWAWFERANEALKGWLSDVHGSRWKQWLIRTAVHAVARELARCGEVPLPLAVSFRRESNEEFNDRFCESGTTLKHPRDYDRIGNCLVHYVYLRHHRLPEQ